jgi:hypothetical protein
MQERADCALQPAKGNGHLQVLRRQDPTAQMRLQKSSDPRERASIGTLMKPLKTKGLTD